MFYLYTVSSLEIQEYLNYTKAVLTIKNILPSPACVSPESCRGPPWWSRGSAGRTSSSSDPGN